MQIPQFLYEILLKQYGEEITNNIIRGYSNKRAVTLRINTLKADENTVKQELDSANIEYQCVEWNDNALIIKGTDESELRKLEIYKQGKIYLQSLSSMIPVILLNPQPNENILDMAAAPGGKTTQIAAMSENKALITACEKNKIRAERLKYNIDKQGANRVNVLIEDARNLDSYFSFDKILLDAPCSGSGTINLTDEKQIKAFTPELVKRSEQTQQTLLNKALQVLKPEHEMIYSTCSILKSENEDNLQKILKNNKAKIVPINKELLKNVPQLPSKLEGTITICPTELYEGFFVVKIRKD